MDMELLLRLFVSICPCLFVFVLASFVFVSLSSFSDSSILRKTQKGLGNEPVLGIFSRKP